MILWHATDYQNIASIMEKGIIPNPYNEVFFADNPASAMMFLVIRGYTHIVAVRIHIIAWFYQTELCGIRPGR